MGEAEDGRKDDTLLDDLTKYPAAWDGEYPMDSITLSRLLGLDRVSVSKLRGPPAAKLADILHSVRASTVSGYFGCSSRVVAIAKVCGPMGCSYVC